MLALLSMTAALHYIASKVQHFYMPVLRSNLKTSRGMEKLP